MSESIVVHREAFILHPLRVLNGLASLRDDQRMFTQQAQHDIALLQRTMEYAYITMDWADILKYDERWFQDHALNVLRVISRMSEEIIKNPEAVSDSIAVVITYLEEGSNPSNNERNEMNLKNVYKALRM